MVDFSYLSRLDVSGGKTADYTLHQVAVGGRAPVLVVGPATEANKPYFNALLKRSGKSARQLRSGQISASMIDENRAEDRELYPKYIVRGWRDVFDGDGTEVEFGADVCAEFLAQLPDWVFDDLRNFCGNPANFTDIVDVEVSGKN